MNGELMLLEVICRPNSAAKSEHHFIPSNGKTDLSIRILGEPNGPALNITSRFARTKREGPSISDSIQIPSAVASPLPEET